MADRPDGTAVYDSSASGASYAPREVMARYNADGVIILQSCVPPGEVETNIVNYLERSAMARPDRAAAVEDLYSNDVDTGVHRL